MTYNIRKGLGANGNNSPLKELREAIRAVDADVVFLQEVMGHSEMKPHRKKGLKQDHLEFLADSVWPHFAYGRNAIRSEGHYGNAVLSKFPFLRWENLDISTNPMENRGLLHGVVAWPGRKEELHLICLHLNLLEGGRSIQVKKLAQRVEEQVPDDRPLIIAGDFNDWRGRACKQLREALSVEEVGLHHGGKHLKTFPSFLPMLPLDRIYYRGFGVSSAQVTPAKEWKNLSDHQALIAHLRIQE